MFSQVISEIMIQRGKFKANRKRNVFYSAYNSKHEIVVPFLYEDRQTEDIRALCFVCSKQKNNNNNKNIKYTLLT